MNSICALKGIGGIILAASMTACVSIAPPQPRAWNVKITARTQHSVRVDLVAFNRTQVAYWQGLQVDDYWVADSSARHGVDRLTFEVVGGQARLADALGVEASGVAQDGTMTVTVPRNHPIWKKWLDRNSVGLAVVGGFPGGAGAGPDQRKVLAPLFRKCWDARKQTLELEILDNRIDLITPPSAKARDYCF
jgi:hypothetical protein